jgi:1-acyl-sn-glycerol-3-phosphate acyltransferase
VFNSVLGISWFWFFGGVFTMQLPNYTKIFLGGTESVQILVLALFSIGVGVGSMLCERLSGHKVEIGLVPFGSIGLTLFGLDLYFARPAATTLHDLGALAFLAAPGSWRIVADFVLVGLFAGFYIVPLFALVQSRAERSELSRVIAGNNILNALFIVAAAAFGLGLSALGWTIPQIFLAVAVLNAIVAIYIYTLVPEFLMRFLSWILVNTLYRIDTRGLDNIPDDGPALLVCNHVSYMDALIVGGVVRRPARFVMYYKIFNIPLLSFIFRTAKAIPIAGAKEDPALLERAFDAIDRALADGEVVCIFPEGGLTRDGEIAPFRGGVEKSSRADRCPSCRWHCAGCGARCSAVAIRCSAARDCRGASARASKSSPARRLRPPTRARRRSKASCANCAAIARDVSLLLDERALDDVIARRADARRHDETTRIEQRAHIVQHRWAAAEHDAVVRGIERRQAAIARQRATVEQGREPALVQERLARDRRVVDEFVAHEVAEEFVARQFVGEECFVGEIGDVAHAVRDDDPVETLVGFRILDQTQERRETGAGAEQVEIAPRLEVMQRERAGRLSADENLVADLQMLQARRQRAVGHLDAEELEMFFPVRTGDAVRAHERTAVDDEADHDEMAAVEAQAFAARGAEAEKVRVPVMDAEDAFGGIGGHAFSRTRPAQDAATDTGFKSGVRKPASDVKSRQPAKDQCPMTSTAASAISASHATRTRRSTLCASVSSAIGSATSCA